MTAASVTKKVKLQLVGLDSNAFVLMGAFRKQARKEGWTPEEISAVIDDCTSGDYNHLLNVLREHCQADGDKLEPEDDTDNEEEEDEEEEDEDFDDEDLDDEDLDDEDLDDEDEEDEEEEEEE